MRCGSEGKISPRFAAVANENRDVQDIAAEYKREKMDVVSSFAFLLQRWRAR